MEERKTTTNLDKFEVIQDIMDEYKKLKDDYLATLKQRHDYMNEYRREYRKLVRALYDIRHSLSKTEDHSEEIEVLMKSSRITLRTHLETFEEQKENDPYSDYDKAIDSVNDALDALRTNVKANKVESIQSDLKRHRIDIRELDALKELLSASSTPEDEQISQIIRLIDYAEDDYLSSFKVYRVACENDEGARDTFDDIFNVLVQLGYDLEASIMADALPDYDEERKQRPNPEELLAVLKPVKSANLEYWSTNRRKAKAYLYNKEYADAVAYARRALLEDREYKGTESAFDRLEDAYNELSSYMYERYHELGGKPYNYHGHMDRKK